MPKSEKTLQIENSIIRRFEENKTKETSVFLSREVKVSTYNRCDLAGYEVHKGKVMENDSIGIEVKISKADFLSGYGTNFCFNWNYVAVPPELVGYALRRLRSLNFDYVGILECCNNGHVFIAKFPRYHFSKGQHYNAARNFFPARHFEMIKSE